jgi:DNA-binding transcriptional ArsR family regulator
MALLEDSGQVRAALSPLRRELLDLLHEPASASELGARLGLPRQKVNYHLGVLERAGLVRLVETRARRGCTERILQATAAEFVVDPQLMGEPRTLRSQDRFAADHLIQVAADTVRDVSRQQAGADEAQKRLLTFTIEAEVSFGQPADVYRFTDALAEAVQVAASEFALESGGQRYRVVVGGHPAPQPDRSEP